MSEPTRIPAPDGVAAAAQYAHVVTGTGRFVAVSGQLPLDEHGAPVGVGDPEAQAHRVFENLRRCLAAAGASFDDVVKLTYFVTDMAHMPAVHVDRVQLGVPGADLAVPVRSERRPADHRAGPLGDQVHHTAVGPPEEGAAALGVLGDTQRVEVRLRHQAPVGTLPAADPDLGDAVAVRERHVPYDEGGDGPVRCGHSPTTANASISIRNSGRTSAATWTAEAAGRRSSGMWAARAVRMAGMWAMSVTK